MAIDFEPQIDFQPEEQPKSTLGDKVSSLAGSIVGAVSPELKTAYDIYKSPAGQKLEDLSAVPYQGLRGITTGLSTVVPAIRSGDAEQLPTPQAALQKASEATQPNYKPVTPEEKGAEFAAQMIEPRTMLLNGLLKSAVEVGKPAAMAFGRQAAKLSEVFNAVDDNNIRKFASDPFFIMSQPSSKVTGKALQAAKEEAGVTQAEERILALSDAAKKRTYRKVMGQIDALPIETKTGREALAAKATAPEGVETAGMGTDELAPIRPPNVEVYSKGQMGKGKNAVTIWGVKGEPNEIAKLGYGTDPASIPEDVLKKHGVPLPGEKVESPISVADLLMAKKAGQDLASKDPSASGLIYKEISEKINPLLKKLAPKVYETQQAVHLSKVKESFMNLFPQGHGMTSYFRAIGMLASMFSPMTRPLGLLESPALTGAGLVAGNLAVRGVTSPVGRQLISGFALRNLLSEEDQRQLQSVKDRLSNGNQ